MYKLNAFIFVFKISMHNIKMNGKIQNNNLRFYFFFIYNNIK